MSKTEEALPPLPKRRRAMFCTKCGFSGPTEAEASPQGAPCQKCDYTAFVEEVDYSNDEMRDYARAALAQRQQVPEGWQLVPKTPTGRMIAEAGNKWVDNAKIYRAMLAAAPALTAAPPAQQSDRCDYCCGTGRFADHACRFCGGKAKGSVFKSQQQQSAQPEQQEPQEQYQLNWRPRR